MERFTCLVERCLSELARFGFDPAPRKLSYSHLRKAGFSHEVGVFGPEICQPMFGIITHA
jgi:hypothetical protein